MQYQRCGNSGILLSRLSLGLWQNFGEFDALSNARNLLTNAFDSGITHFDLVNNYDLPHDAADCIYDKIFKRDLSCYSDELITQVKR